MLKLLPFVLVLIIVPAVLLSPIFKVKQVDFQSDKSCTINDDQKLKGENIFLVKKDKVQKYFIEKLPCAKDITVEKKFPSKIVIQIKSKEPVAKIEGKKLQVTVDGFISQLQDDKSKPVFYPPPGIKLEPGSKIEDAKSLFALKIAEGLSKSDFTTASVRVVDGDVAAYSQKDFMVLFSSEKDASDQIDSLQKILGQAKIDAAKITKIDLRFEKPVISYK